MDDMPYYFQQWAKLPTGLFFLAIKLTGLAVYNFALTFVGASRPMLIWSRKARSNLFYEAVKGFVQSASLEYSVPSRATFWAQASKRRVLVS